MSYDRHINILPAKSVPQGDMRFLSASEMIYVCNIFLDSMQNHFEARWLPTKECRSELSKFVERNFLDEWDASPKWKELIQHGLDCMVHGRNNLRMAEWEHWDSLKQLESDMYLSIQASYKTINLFRLGDPQYLPMATDVFVVPSQWNKFLGSLMAGDIYPAWIAKVDSSSTPEIEDGTYPMYSLRS
ncbi:TPA: hypothetical protein ACKROV_000984 [Providencia alcalifaciens]|uniref:hypothetical protein n=1 Tax=Providencia sp. wls1950 TaxID=2675147 RepID=UPI0012B5A364|nr:hypothetical protein [Providencia sp. wls1950]MTB44086.1 hypothetical protein [Providencia sp. wls1950]